MFFDRMRGVDTLGRYAFSEADFGARAHAGDRQNVADGHRSGFQGYLFGRVGRFDSLTGMLNMQPKMHIDHICLECLLLVDVYPKSD